MTKLWQHMMDTHDLSLIESEEADIRWAANEDAEKELFLCRAASVNQTFITLSQKQTIRKLRAKLKERIK